MARLYNITGLGLSDVNQGQLQSELATLGNVGLSWVPSQSAFVCTIFDTDITNQQVQTVADEHDKTVLTTEQQINTATLSIQELRSLATSNAAFIASLISLILNADVASDGFSDRYDELVTLIAGATTGVRNAFLAAFLAEDNIDVTTIGANNLTDDQKRAALRFARRFANSWAIVLIS